MSVLMNIGRYQFYPKRVGKGAYSSVFKGFESKTGAIVAIKRIDLFSIKKYEHMIRNEIAIMRRLDHPNIVSLYDVIEDPENDYIYIVMEYCEYGDMATYIKHRPLKEEFARTYMRQLADVMQYLYENRIMHRDIKPHNILIADKNTIKLSDFGFAKVLEQEQMVQTVCGSPLYMAPEICQDNGYTVKSDLWSIGVMLFEMVTSKTPYTAMNHMDLLRKIETESFYFPHYLNISADCKDIVIRLLERDPSRRMSWDEFFGHRWFKNTLAEENQLLETIDDVFESTLPGSLMLIDSESESEYEDDDDSVSHSVAGDSIYRTPSQSFTIDKPVACSEPIKFKRLPRDLFYKNRRITEDDFEIIEEIPTKDQINESVMNRASSLPMRLMNSSINYLSSYFF